MPLLPSDQGFVAVYTVFLDGLLCDTPEARSFTELAEGAVGAVAGREGVFGHYSWVPAEGQPNPEHVTAPKPAQA